MRKVGVRFSKHAPKPWWAEDRVSSAQGSRKRVSCAEAMRKRSFGLIKVKRIFEIGHVYVCMYIYIYIYIYKYIYMYISREREIHHGTAAARCVTA